MTCQTFDTVTICGPSRWVEFSRESIGIKWCFGCRKHAEHFWVVAGDPEPNYYGPSIGRKCALCNHDRTAFPGCEASYWPEDY